VYPPLRGDPENEYHLPTFSTSNLSDPYAHERRIEFTPEDSSSSFKTTTTPYPRILARESPVAVTPEPMRKALLSYELLRVPHLTHSL
jgi:hypothetical protein